MKVINVGFVLTSMPVGGQERVVLELVRKLDSSRYRTYVYCLKEPGRMAEEVRAAGVEVQGPLYASKWDLRVLPRLVSRMRRDKLDVIEAVGEGDAMFWGRLAALLAGVPVITSAIHCTKDSSGKKGVGGFNRLLTRLTDKFIAIGDGQKAYLVHDEKLPESSVLVIYNGIDASDFEPSVVDALKLRREIGVGTDVPLVGILAALRPEKSHGIFLRAAATIVKKFPDARFVIIGDGVERSNIESQTRQLGLEEAVVMLGTRRDIPDVLSGLNIGVLCSDARVETSPSAVLEYMCASLPVVATKVGSLEEMVEDGITGFLVPPQNPEKLAEAIMSLLADRDKAQEMGQAGKRKILRQFSIENMTRPREDLWMSLLEAKGKGC